MQKNTQKKKKKKTELEKKSIDEFFGLTIFFILLGVPFSSLYYTNRDNTEATQLEISLNIYMLHNSVVRGVRQPNLLFAMYVNNFFYSTFHYSKYVYEVYSVSLSLSLLSGCLVARATMVVKFFDCCKKSFVKMRKKKNGTFSQSIEYYFYCNI